MNAKVLLIPKSMPRHSEPVLAHPSPNEPFILDTDASAYGVCAVLSQIQNGKEVVIAYGSKTLPRSQMGYCIAGRVHVCQTI